MSTLTVPGKIFLMGEYNVLQGGVAVLAAVKPGYSFSKRKTPVARVHSDSPLGRYEAETGKHFSFVQDNSSMLPGFGGSTAELITGVYLDVERLPETKRLWAWYKEQFPKTSGADLAVQLEALRMKTGLFEFENGNTYALPRSPLLSQIHVFSVDASKKVATHEALEEKRPPLDVTRLNTLVWEFKTALQENEFESLSVLTDYANDLAELEVESKLSHHIRMAFQDVPDVVGVKGCGALLNDVFLVAGSDGKSIQKCARDLDLYSFGTLAECLW